jgi:hypothetical protein
MQHVHDTADDAPVINPMRATTTSGQQRLDPPPLGIAEPIDLLRHPSLQITSENLNHSLLAAGIPN